MPRLQSWAQELVGERVPQEVTYKMVSFVFSVNKISRISPVLAKLWASTFQNLFLSRPGWSPWGKVPATGWCAPPCPASPRASGWCPSWAVVSHHRSWAGLPPPRPNHRLQTPVCLLSWAAWGGWQAWKHSWVYKRATNSFCYSPSNKHPNAFGFEPLSQIAWTAPQKESSESWDQLFYSYYILELWGMTTSPSSSRGAAMK